MKAAVVGDKGLESREVPRPHPKPNKVLVRVRASSLNRADFGVVLQTMHDALVTNGRLKSGERVLIQGASSRVGLMGLQIAKFDNAAAAKAHMRANAHFGKMVLTV